MPNPRKPRLLKDLEGTLRPDRDRPEPEFPVSDNPAPPTWVCTVDALEEWDRLVPLLSATRVLTEADLTALGHLCNLHGACVKLYRANMDPDAAKLTQLRLYLTEFGLTPAARSKAQPVKGGGKKNAFEALSA